MVFEGHAEVTSDPAADAIASSEEEVKSARRQNLAAGSYRPRFPGETCLR